MITLTERAVHVWQADLDSLADGIACPLAADERERAQRIAGWQARRRWGAARGFLRMVLGAYLDVDPSSLLLAVESMGKPSLASDHNPRLHFNLSHSGPIALCAVTRMCAVGIDVQVERRLRDPAAIARRVLGEQPSERLRALCATEREAELLRVWAAFEAEQKRTGTGIGGARMPISGPRPWMAWLDVGPGAAAAVALALPPLQLSWQHWHHGGRQTAGDTVGAAAITRAA